jgi:hypothetical protein
MFYRNCLLKNIMEEIIEGMIDVKEGKEEVRQYWVILGK